MGNYNEFDLDLNRSSDDKSDAGVYSTSNPCWAITTYITSSILNGNCFTVTNDACKCEGYSISTPCGSSGYRIK